MVLQKYDYHEYRIWKNKRLENHQVYKSSILTKL